jgi:alanyl-tRNA synthetase
MGEEGNINPAEKVVKVKDVKLYKGVAVGVDRADLRDMIDALRRQIRMDSGVIVLGWRSEDKAALVVSVSKDLTARLDAAKIVRAVATHIEGSGGGRKDLAEAGGKNPAKLDEAIQAVPGIIEQML